MSDQPSGPAFPDTPSGLDPDLDRPGLDRESVEAMERTFAAVSASFLGYVVRTSGVEVRDDLDRRVLAFYEEWLHEEAACGARIAAFIEEHGGNAVRGAAPLGYAQYNYLGAAYLLRRVIATAGQLAAGLREALLHETILRERRGSPPLTPEMHDLTAALIEAEDRYIAKARKLLDSAARPPQPPPRPKGASAARW